MTENEKEAEQKEKGRWLFAQACTFVAGAVDVDRVPLLSLPEIAFVGRSNVGKSSLVNALTGQNTLARTSNTPGRTQQLNFFNLGERLALVDLPGYGYAKAPRKDINGWNTLIYKYLRGSRELQRVCLLLDSRRGIKDSDKKIMDILDDDAVSYQIIFTKSDKVTADELAKIIADAEALFSSHPALYNEIIVTSSRKSRGIEQLRAELARFMVC